MREKVDKIHLYYQFSALAFKENIKLNGNGLSRKCLGFDVLHSVQTDSLIFHEDILHRLLDG